MANASLVASRQRGILATAYSQFLSKGEQYALVDFPNHANVGDSAIWLGEISLLKETTGNLPRYTCDYENFDPKELSEAHPEGPILLHGGGNFGDLWPAHHDLRCRIISAFTDRKIIQLPQTIYFKSTSSLAETREIIGRHPSFSLCVRDRSSEELAQAGLGCAAALLPDSAFGLWPLSFSQDSNVDVLMLLREDLERSSTDYGDLRRISNTRATDWLDDPDRFIQRCRRRNRFRSWGRGGWTMKTGRYSLFESLASKRLERGLRTLSEGRIVLTDRLHAHILAVLLNKPHIVFDNSYGKISGYIDAWTHDCDILSVAHSAQEALTILKRPRYP